MIDANALRQLLTYDAASGQFTWLVNRSNGVKAGNLAHGRVDSRGYVQICVGGKRHLAHRLAWLYAHGEWPSMQIDHINGDRLDNRLGNLRHVSRDENVKNKRVYHNSKTGVPGVSFRKGRWLAVIGTAHVGSFDTKQEAIAARKREEARLNYHANHGRAA